MKTFARTLLLFTLAAVVAAPAMAQDKKKGKKQAGKARGPQVRVYTLPRAVTATLKDDQKTQLKAIEKEYRPKLLEIAKKRAAVLTPDQKAMLEKAVAGKKGRERVNARNKARRSLTYSSSQKKELAELTKQDRALRTEVNKKVNSVLTDEQKELRKKASKRKGGKKGTKKKKPAA